MRKHKESMIESRIRTKNLDLVRTGTCFDSATRHSAAHNKSEYQASTATQFLSKLLADPRNHVSSFKNASLPRRKSLRRLQFRPDFPHSHSIVSLKSATATAPPLFGH